MRIEIVVFDGFDELDVFGPFEVLSMAGLDTASRVATTIEYPVSASLPLPPT